MAISMAYRDESKVIRPTGQKRINANANPIRLSVQPIRRTAATLAGLVSSDEPAISLTPEVPKPHPANEDTLPLKALKMPTNPTPEAPKTSAMTLVLTNAVAKTTI
jgi:hypothetical protein